MKKLILLAATAFFSLSCQAQNLHFDTTANLTYVNIEPVTWVRNQPPVKRLYISSANDNLLNKGVLLWQLRSEVIIDANTRNYNVVASGTATITGHEYELWDAESKYLFTYIANQLNLELK